MEAVVEIKNRSITIDTALHREEYCRTAMLFYVLDGMVEFSYENRKSCIERTGILVINRGIEYQYDGSDNLIMASLELMGKNFETACDGIRRSIQCDSSKGEDVFYNEIWGILRQMILDQEYVRENQKAYGYLVFDYYSQYYKLLELLISSAMEVEMDRGADLGSGMGNAERKEKIDRYLNIHFAEPVSLEELSRELYLSKGYLSKFFTQSFGVTFSQYVKELRLRRAMSDILYTDKSITQISFDNGFTSSSFFNRAFREKYQKNPSEVRREFLDTEEQKRTKKEEEQLHQRISQLIGEAEIRKPQEIQKKQFRYSVREYVPTSQCWNLAINIGSASDILKTDIQEHILLLNRSVHYQYARFWDPFSKELLLDVNEVRGSYNFSRLDQVFDSLLQNGMKPFVVFEPKLERVNERADRYFIKAEHETVIKDLDAWKSILKAFVRHIIRKYGMREVNTWKFELPYEVYVIKGMGMFESYIELYTSLTETVREYTDQLMIGGPTLPSAEEKILDAFIQETKSRGCVPDFFSMISFAYEVDKSIHRYSIRSADEDYLLNDITKVTEVLEKNGIHDIPIFITEWNQTVADRNFVNDSCYRGAYIVRSLLAIHKQVSMAGYFSGTDRRADYYDSYELLQGGNGLMSRDGILKPAGFAMVLLNMLADNEIATEEHFMVTTDGLGSYFLVAHNQRKLGYYYYQTAENEIGKEQVGKCCEDESYLEQEVELGDVENGEYQIRTQRVNAHYGSVLDIWRDFGYSSSLTQHDIRYIKRICEPHLELDTITVDTHCISLNLLMEPNEIVFVEIRQLI